MEQAKGYVCRSCLVQVPVEHRFCVYCGALVPEGVGAPEARFFSALQDPGKARLVVLRGQGLEGLTYHLNGLRHVLGRDGQLGFPEDPFLSPRHASFTYRGGKLFVRDEESVNGVYRRLREPALLQTGDTFLAGLGVFRVSLPASEEAASLTEDTLHAVSAHHPAHFRVDQLLVGGRPGATYCAVQPRFALGRAGCDLVFPADPYLELAHCSIQQVLEGFLLRDHETRNGTFVRLAEETELVHGDTLSIGGLILRVEFPT